MRRRALQPKDAHLDVTGTNAAGTQHFFIGQGGGRAVRHRRLQRQARSLRGGLRCHWRQMVRKRVLFLCEICYKNIITRCLGLQSYAIGASRMSSRLPTRNKKGLSHYMLMKIYLFKANTSKRLSFVFRFLISKTKLFVISLVD